jgi:hypothetical protein
MNSKIKNKLGVLGLLSVSLIACGEGKNSKEGMSPSSYQDSGVLTGRDQSTVRMQADEKIRQALSAQFSAAEIRRLPKERALGISAELIANLLTSAEDGKDKNADPFDELRTIAFAPLNQRVVTLSEESNSSVLASEVLQWVADFRATWASEGREAARYDLGEVAQDRLRDLIVAADSKKEMDQRLADLLEEITPNEETLQDLAKRVEAVSEVFSEVRDWLLDENWKDLKNLKVEVLTEQFMDVFGVDVSKSYGERSFDERDFFDEMSTAVEIARIVMRDLLGDQKTADQVYELGTVAIQVSRITSEMIAGKTITQLAMGDVFGAVTGMLTFFAGPQADVGHIRYEQVIKTLTRMNENIRLIHAEMHQRFDLIDRKLNALAVGLQEQMTQIIELRQDVAGARGDIRALHQEARSIRIAIRQAVEDLLETQFRDQYGRCLGASSRLKSPSLSQEAKEVVVGECIAYFRQRAVENSQLGGRVNGVITDETFASENSESWASGHFFLPALVRDLNRSLPRHQRIEEVANPIDWFHGAEALLEMHMTHPGLIPGWANVGEIIDEVIKVGKEIQFALLEVGRTDFLELLVNRYEDQLIQTVRSANSPDLAQRAAESGARLATLAAALSVSRPELRYGDKKVLQALQLKGKMSLPRQSDLGELGSNESHQELSSELRIRGLSGAEEIRNVLRRAESESRTRYPDRTFVDSTLERLETLRYLLGH